MRLRAFVFGMALTNVAHAAVPSSTKAGQSAYETPFGGMIQFGVRVSDPNDPSLVATGTVTLRTGATVLGTVPLENSVAHFYVTTLEVGKHSITADYSGDETWLPSTSNAVPHVVYKTGVTTVIDIAPVKAQVGEFVTVTAKLTPYYGSVVPTGTVTVLDQQTNATIGMYGIDGSGAVSFTTNTLDVGAHKLILIYSGDMHYVNGALGATTATIEAAPVVDAGVDASLEAGAPDSSLPIVPDASTSTPSSNPPTSTPTPAPTPTLDPAPESPSPEPPHLYDAGGGCGCQTTSTSGNGFAFVVLPAIALFIRSRSRRAARR